MPSIQRIGVHVLKEVRDAAEGFRMHDDELRLRILNELLLLEVARALERGTAFRPRNGPVVPRMRVERAKKLLGMSPRAFRNECSSR